MVLNLIAVAVGAPSLDHLSASIALITLDLLLGEHAGEDLLLNELNSLAVT